MFLRIDKSRVDIYTSLMICTQTRLPWLVVQQGAAVQQIYLLNPYARVAQGAPHIAGCQPRIGYPAVPHLEKGYPQA